MFVARQLGIHQSSAVTCCSSVLVHTVNGKQRYLIVTESKLRIGYNMRLSRSSTKRDSVLVSRSFFCRRIVSPSYGNSHPRNFATSRGLRAQEYLLLCYAAFVKELPKIFPENAEFWHFFDCTGTNGIIVTN